MKLKHVWMAGTLATALVFTACNKNDDDDASKDVNAQDETFIIKAAQSNQSEVELGTLALSKGSDSLVKAFAQAMVNEHADAQAQLEDIVKDQNTNVGITDTLDAEQVATSMLLQGLSGAAFDSAYMDSQIKGHTKTLGIFDAELASGQNAQLKGYATDKRPNIQKHLMLADSIYSVRFNQ
jgi:putative membrane protein